MPILLFQDALKKEEIKIDNGEEEDDELLV
jgi:hypothetical protein